MVFEGGEEVGGKARGFGWEKGRAEVEGVSGGDGADWRLHFWYLLGW